MCTSAITVYDTLYVAPSCSYQRVTITVCTVCVSASMLGLAERTLFISVP